MTLNKKEIIDELISLEPELEGDRNKLENMLEDIINVKPSIDISSNFKEELKKKILYKINNRADIYTNNKYSYIKFFISFFLGGITTYSIMGVIGINFSFIQSDSTGNINVELIEEVSDKGDISIQRAIPIGARMGVMNIELDIISEEAELMSDESELMGVQSMMMKNKVPIDSNNLFYELRIFLDTLNLDPLVIEKIIDIVKKYK